MADDPVKKKTPAPFGVPITPAVERHASRPHRDHRRRSESDTMDEDFEDEDFTAKLDVGDELDAARASRPDRIRLHHLEKNQDQLRKEIADIRDDVRNDVDGLRSEVGGVKVAVADMGGQFKVIPQLVDAMKDATTALREREHVTLTAKLEVDKARALDEVKATGDKRADTLDANKTKREWVTRGIAIVSSLAAIVATAVAAGRC